MTAKTWASSGILSNGGFAGAVDVDRGFGSGWVLVVCLWLAAEELLADAATLSFQASGLLSFPGLAFSFEAVAGSYNVGFSSGEFLIQSRELRGA